MIKCEVQARGRQDDCKHSSLGNSEYTQKASGNRGLRKGRQIAPGDIYLGINHIKCQLKP